MELERFSEKVEAWFQGAKKFGPLAVITKVTDKKTIPVDAISDEQIHTLTEIKRGRFMIGSDKLKDFNLDFLALRGSAYIVLGFNYEEGRKETNMIIFDIDDYIKYTGNRKNMTFEDLKDGNKRESTLNKSRVQMSILCVKHF